MFPCICLLVSVWVGKHGGEDLRYNAGIRVHAVRVVRREARVGRVLHQGVDDPVDHQQRADLERLLVQALSLFAEPVEHGGPPVPAVRLRRHVQRLGLDVGRRLREGREQRPRRLPHVRHGTELKSVMRFGSTACLAVLGWPDLVGNSRRQSLGMGSTWLLKSAKLREGAELVGLDEARKV